MDDSDRLSAMREFLREQLGAQRFDLWLGSPTELRLDNATLHVTCASRAEVLWIKRKLQPELVARCGDFLQAEVAVVLHVSAARPAGAERQASCSTAQTLLPLERPTRPAACAALPCPSQDRPHDRRVSDRWTFATFVEGVGNQLAVRVAQEAARRPGRYSPLVLCGAAGTGKTHLLEAIAQEARRGDSRGGVLYATAEQFTAQFLESLDRRLLPSFREKYRRLGMLLVDDVQFFGGKRATIEELLHTLDAIQRRGGQVVLAADRGPAEWATISAELAARAAAGLSVQLELPDYATRLAIVRGIDARLQLGFTEDVQSLIAQQVVGSARMLGGAINRLVATSMARSVEVSTELAAETLSEYCRHHAPQVRLTDIQRVVCEVFAVEPKRLKGDSRARAVAEPRALAMWLARKYTNAALSEIGDFFGRRSHSTVVAASKRIDELVRRDGEVVLVDARCPVEEAIRRLETALRTA